MSLSRFFIQSSFYVMQLNERFRRIDQQWTAYHIGVCITMQHRAPNQCCISSHVYEKVTVNQIGTGILICLSESANRSNNNVLE